MGYKGYQFHGTASTAGTAEEKGGWEWEVGKVHATDANLNPCTMRAPHRNGTSTQRRVKGGSVCVCVSMDSFFFMFHLQRRLSTCSTYLVRTFKVATLQLNSTSCTWRSRQKK